MEEVRFTGKLPHISLDRYQSLLEAERKMIDIEKHEKGSINIPIEQEFNSVVEENKTIEEILAEREKTHGDFRTHAAITDAIKYHMHNSSKWDYLSSIQREALDMTAHKIGRILAGDPDHKDHWDDIAGYATLVARELK
mgnify:CR=1 FL=1